MAYKSILSNFVLNTWPDNCVDKLLFPVKEQLNLTKQSVEIILVDKLQQILKPECILDISSFKPWADNLVTIFTNTIKINFDENPVKNNVQQIIWQCLAWPRPAINIFCPVFVTLVFAILVSIILVPATTDFTTTDIPYSASTTLTLTTAALTNLVQPALLIKA